MAVRVLIHRRIISGNEIALTELLIKLRAKAMHANGYISGETLRALDDPHEYLVISTWRELEDWRKWETNPERQEIQGRIDELLATPSVHRVFVYDY